MTKLDVTVSIDGGKEVYRAGESVKGYWTIENKEPIKVKGINCYFHGATYVKWSETEAVQGRTVERDYISHEKYTSSFVNYFGRKPSVDGPNKILEPGRYVYKFNFSIPDDKLPSSFEGVKGAVRYWLLLKIERPLWPDILKTKCVTVLDDVNINLPFYGRQKEKSAKKQLSKALGFGDAGELTLYGKIDRTGYCPGETIAISVTANNQTTKDLGPLKASLVQSVDYRANGEVKVETNIIHSVVGAPLKQGETRNWKNQLLKIDAVPPSTRARTCHCLIVDYYVKILVDVPLIYGGDLVVTLPIVIGTVPQGHVRQVASASASSTIPETDARSAITYTKCNKGWTYFTRTPKSSIAFYKTDYNPMCAYVPNFKFVDKTTTNQRNAGINKTTSPAANKTNANIPAKNATSQNGTGKSPSAPPLEHTNLQVAPPSYEEAISVISSEQSSILDDETEDVEFAIVFRFKEAVMEKFKDTISKSKGSLEKFEGKIAALTSKEVKVKGSYEKGMVVAMLTFPSKQNAEDWMTFNTVVTDPDWRDSCDITIVNCKEKIQDGRKLLLLYDLERKQDATENDLAEVVRITNQTIKPIRLANGGSTLASTSNFTSVRGKLVDEGHRFVITTWISMKHFTGYPKHVPADIYERFKELTSKCYNNVYTAIYELQDLSGTQNINTEQT